MLPLWENSGNARNENAPAIGFIAHMDTVSDYCDHDIKPVITEKYDGEALALEKVELP